MATQDDVRRLALELPETVEGIDRFAFEVRGKGFAWSYMERVAPKKPRVERPDVIAIRTDTVADKDDLIAAEPDKYFTDDHYRGFPAVLARIAELNVDELRELLVDGWRTKAPRTLVKQYDADRTGD